MSRGSLPASVKQCHSPVVSNLTAASPARRIGHLSKYEVADGVGRRIGMTIAPVEGAATDRDEDYDDYDRPRRRRQPPPPGVEPTEFLIPTGVSTWSMAACYFGLFSCVVAIPRPDHGDLLRCRAASSQLRRRKKANTYGAVTGDVRAIIGIVCSSLTIIGYSIFAMYLLTKK